MKYEIDLYGVAVPSMLLWLVVTYVIYRIVRILLQKVGFYRRVWHPALFDLSIFVCLLGGVVYLSAELLL